METSLELSLGLAALPRYWSTEAEPQHEQPWEIQGNPPCQSQVTMPDSHSYLRLRDIMLLPEFWLWALYVSSQQVPQELKASRGRQSCKQRNNISAIRAKPLWSFLGMVPVCHSFWDRKPHGSSRIIHGINLLVQNPFLVAIFLSWGVNSCLTSPLLALAQLLQGELWWKGLKYQSFWGGKYWLLHWDW